MIDEELVVVVLLAQRRGDVGGVACKPKLVSEMRRECLFRLVLLRSSDGVWRRMGE